MTLCIAAFAIESGAEVNQPSIVFCSDTRIETSTSSAETTYKFRKVSDGWAAMFAGDVGRALELLSIYSSQLQSKSVDEAIGISDLRVPPQVMKKRLASEYVSSMTGLSLEEFIAGGQSCLPAGLYESIWNDIARVEIGCQLILAPTNTPDLLYAVDQDGTVSTREHFCAIGTGCSNAEAWLYYREQRTFDDLDRTVVHLLEAKRFAENAPGVGKKTHLSYLDRDKKFHQMLDVEEMETNIWKRYGPRPTTAPQIEMCPDEEPTPWDELGVG